MPLLILIPVKLTIICMPREAVTKKVIFSSGQALTPPPLCGFPKYNKMSLLLSWFEIKPTEAKLTKPSPSKAHILKAVKFWLSRIWLCKHLSMVPLVAKWQWIWLESGRVSHVEPLPSNHPGMVAGHSKPQKDKKHKIPRKLFQMKISLFWSWYVVLPVM